MTNWPIVRGSGSKGLVPPSIYLDTNAFSYLFNVRPGWSAATLIRVRARLLEAVATSSVQVVTSHALLEELSRLAGHDQKEYGPVHRYFWKLTGSRFLKSIADLTKAEIASSGRLPEPDRFDSRQDRRTVESRSRRLSYLSSGQRLSRQRGLRHQRWLKDAVEGIKRDPRPRGLEPGQLFVADETIMAPARSMLRENPPLVSGFDAVMLDGLELSQAFAVWNYSAFMLARILNAHLFGRRIQTSDLADAEHYTYACYCDVMITNDRRLVETSGHLRPPFEFQPFESLATSIS